MAKRPTAYFGAIPFRALADRGLTELDVRILGVVSAHDNMSLIRGGEGCWAGTDRIAALANANVNNASSSITKLVQLGYLVRGPHPLDRRRSTFRVVFDARLDQAAFKGDTSPTGEIPPGDTSPAPAKVSRPHSAGNGGIEPKSMPNIPEDTLNRPSAESAPPTEDAMKLRKIEEGMEKGKRINAQTEEWIAEMAEGDHDDPLANWARRLVNRIE